MKPKQNPEMIDEEHPEWTDEMFAQAEPMTKTDPELVEMSKSLCSKPKSEHSKILLSIQKYYVE
jgi:tRNA U34 5-methylaminomethyl-2-thiouridine-forming methyltransferase MnmC